jgi:hypothetical protein
MTDAAAADAILAPTSARAFPPRPRPRWPPAAPGSARTGTWTRSRSPA